jgi:hypothetical protein
MSKPLPLHPSFISMVSLAVPPAPTFREKRPALQSVMTHRAKGIAEIYFP